MVEVFKKKSLNNVNEFYKTLTKYIASKFNVPECYSYPSIIDNAEQPSSTRLKVMEDDDSVHLISFCDMNCDNDSNSFIGQCIKNVIFKHILLNNVSKLDDIEKVLEQLKEKQTTLIDDVTAEITKAVKQLLFGIDMNFISTLSAEKYESEELSGQLMIYSKNQTIPRITVPFDVNKGAEDFRPQVKNLRFYRKLLAMTSSSLALAVEMSTIFPNDFSASSLKEFSANPLNDSYASGLIDVNSAPDGSIFVQLFGDYKWRLLVKKRGKLVPLVVYKGGMYYFDNQNSNEYFEKCSLPDSLKSCKDTLKTLIDKIKEDPIVHGALLIFTSDLSHIDCLCNNCFGISLVPIEECKSDDCDSLTIEKDQDIIVNFCRIDGAVIFDLSGKVLAIGTILDGKIKGAGDRSRGSRFNSAKVFVDNCPPKKECYAIVISEDGPVKLLSKNNCT